MQQKIQEAKKRLPLSVLMHRLGHGEAARKSSKCPFHEDQSNSFSIFQGANGMWFWKCHAGCGQGDEINYLEKARGLNSRDAIAMYLREAGVN